MTAVRRRYDLLKSRLNRFSKLSDKVEQGNARAIHGTRVASRRLRELLPVLELRADSADKLGRQLRRITRRLGRIRELDVLLAHLEELRSEGHPGTAALGIVIDAARQDRAKVAKRASSRSLDEDLERIDRQLHKVADGLEKADTRRTGRRWVWALDARVVNRAVTLRRAVEKAGTMYWPKRLHETRVAIKKLRYGLELALEASGSKDRADLMALRRSQDLLGRLHDLQLVIERARQAQASAEPFNVDAWHDFDVLVSSLENDCRRLHERYLRTRPAIIGICDRLASTKSAVDVKPAQPLAATGPAHSS